MIDDPDDAAETARRGRERFLAHFTTEVIARQMLQFYERALDRG